MRAESNGLGACIFGFVIDLLLHLVVVISPNGIEHRY